MHSTCIKLISLMQIEERNSLLFHKNLFRKHRMHNVGWIDAIYDIGLQVKRALFWYEMDILGPIRIIYYLIHVGPTFKNSLKNTARNQFYPLSKFHEVTCYVSISSISIENVKNKHTNSMFLCTRKINHGIWD